MGIVTTMQAQHRHCDELLAQAEAAARREDWTACAAASAAFVADTEAHLALEENGLFPAFEKATGMSFTDTEIVRGVLLLGERAVPEFAGQL